MTLQSKRELIQAIRKGYQKASKGQKSAHVELRATLQRDRCGNCSCRYAAR
jgi:hypothetical protein